MTPSEAAANENASTTSRSVADPGLAIDTADSSADVALRVQNLNFDYGAASDFKPILKNVTFSLPKGELMRMYSISCFTQFIDF
jgi:ABC-type multidrug transport system fused ATPase/permease subunit